MTVGDIDINKKRLAGGAVAVVPWAPRGGGAHRRRPHGWVTIWDPVEGWVERVAGGYLKRQTSEA